MGRRAAIIITGMTLLPPTRPRLRGMAWKNCAVCCMKRVLARSTCAANAAPSAICMNVQTAANNILVRAGILRQFHAVVVTRVITHFTSSRFVHKPAFFVYSPDPFHLCCKYSTQKQQYQRQWERKRHHHL